MSFRKRLFPVLAGLLWLAFLTLDLTGWGDSTWVKFAAICLCCATAFTIHRFSNSIISYCIQHCRQQNFIIYNFHT